MRFKWIPAPPDSLAAVRAAHRAIPLVPASEADCLRRLVDRTDTTDDRDDASEWLRLLQALTLVEQTPSGYRRERLELTTDELADRLREGVYGARELDERLTVADEPLSIDELDGTVELPTWEYHHRVDPEGVRWQRLRRLVEWFVLCGVAKQTADGCYLNE